MKKLLPILLCYVLMTSQVFAIDGGPVFGGRGVNPIGTYSGVINVNQELDPVHPMVDPVTGTLVPSVVADFSAIGLFDLAVPSVDVATGSFLLFVDGVVYTGTITASVNPDSDQLNGVLEGIFGFTEISQGTGTGGTTTIITTSVSALAAGKVTAQIGGTRQGSISTATLGGSATIDVDKTGIQNGVFTTDNILNCSVSGFRQSFTSSSVSSVTVGTGS